MLVSLLCPAMLMIQKMSMKIDSESDRRELQKDLDKVFTWSDNNSMLFNNDKLEFIHFSRSSTTGPGNRYVTSSGTDI